MHPTLKVETTNTFDYDDLEKLVKELYDQDIRILDMLFEVNNGSYREYTVNGEDELWDIDDPGIVAEWVETNKIPYRNNYHGEYIPVLDVNHIMHRLFKEGHISEGRYVMRVDW